MSFLDAFMDMKDEYIFLPHNVAALNRTMKSYESVGLPGACGSIDGGTLSGLHVPLVIIIVQRARRDIQQLRSSV